ncbi:hypothetical protein BC629DRAFT_1472709 [Irpex lacteus]|nr:hypothetical protein BC629DRAFT_1472709 [Irpex lacteus]
MVTGRWILMCAVFAIVPSSERLESVLLAQAFIPRALDSLCSFSVSLHCRRHGANYPSNRARLTMCGSRPLKHDDICEPIIHVDTNLMLPTFETHGLGSFKYIA